MRTIIAVSLVLNCVFSVYFLFKYVDPERRSRTSEIKPGDVVFVGNSLTDLFKLADLGKNRGVSGNRTDHLLARIGPIAEKKPSKIFIEIGTNDLNQCRDVDSVFVNFKRIVEQISSKSPSTKIYVHSVFPVSGYYLKHKPQILEYNSKVETFCKQSKITYMDMWDVMSEDGELKYSKDGVHLTDEGYRVWRSVLYKYL
jgi:lysophospholipase L1-like esterase